MIVLIFCRKSLSGHGERNPGKARQACWAEEAEIRVWESQGSYNCTAKVCISLSPRLSSKLCMNKVKFYNTGTPPKKKRKKIQMPKTKTKNWHEDVRRKIPRVHIVWIFDRIQAKNYNVTISSIQSKVTHAQKEESVNRNRPRVTEVIEFIGKNFKTAT